MVYRRRLGSSSQQRGHSMYDIPQGAGFEQRNTEAFEIHVMSTSKTCSRIVLTSAGPRSGEYGQLHDLLDTSGPISRQYSTVLCLSWMFCKCHGVPRFSSLRPIKGCISLQVSVLSEQIRLRILSPSFSLFCTYLSFTTAIQA